MTKELPQTARDAFATANDAASILRELCTGMVGFVARRDRALVGVLGIQHNRHVHHLYVAPSFRGHGIAGRLCSVGFDHCLARGNPGIFTVHVLGPAVGFYEALGFVARPPRRTPEGLCYTPMRLVMGSLDD